MSLKDETVAITGGAGFIGSHLVRYLEDQGVARILVLDDLRHSRNGSAVVSSSKVELVPLTLGDQNANVTELTSLLQGISYIFHLAAEKHQQDADAVADYFKTNIEGTYALLEAAVAARVRRVVYTSTLYVYGRMTPPACDEHDLPCPRTIYGATKLCAEHLLAYFKARFDLSNNILRYFFVYGPGQHTGMGYRSVIVKNFARLLAGLPPSIVGDGQQVLDYVYVEDAVRATVAAMTCAPDGLCLNVGSGTGMTINDLVAQIQEAAGTAFVPDHLPADWTAGSSRVARIERIRDTLGWVPEIGLQEGLRRTYAWVSSQSHGA